MVSRLAGSLALIGALTVAGTGCGSSSSSGSSSTSTTTTGEHVSLLGAGSSFDYPFFSKAFAAYSQKHNVSVNYQPIGSGAGISQLTVKTINFGASDVPMNASELAAAQKSGGLVIQVPIALGGVSIAYNVPNVKSRLRLTPGVLAQIFLGKITTWNAPSIRVLNPHDTLPNLHIAVVHRADSSGTSYIFTNYLSDVSPQWKAQVGTGKQPAWPVGIGGSNNAGVATLVKGTPGAVGYVELAYVLQTGMTQAAVQNKAGQFVTPSLQTVASAAAHFSHVTPQKFSIVNAPGAQSYPIVGYSWALVYKRPTPTSKAAALRNLISWTATSGQAYAASVHYVPLPPAVEQLARTQILRMQV
jgi:phosphate transport system substrate-binding protein